MKTFASVTVIIICLLVSACEKKVAAPAQTTALKRYDFKGKIVEISDKEKKIAKIQHEEIKGFMSAMTMKFPVKDDANFAKLEAGDSLTAILIYNPNDNRSWLENLAITKGAPVAGVVASPPASATPIP